MKKPPKYFYSTYPYLAYFIEDWGEMQTSGGGNYPYLCLVDEGGNVYTDWETSDRDEALQKQKNTFGKWIFQVEWRKKPSPHSKKITKRIT
jgi:hypothetical protein